MNYEKGTGVNKDVWRANEFYKQGCDLKNGGGCCNLGFNYERGNGVNKDIWRANEFFKQACDLSQQLGCEWMRI